MHMYCATSCKITVPMVVEMKGEKRMTIQNVNYGACVLPRACGPYIHFGYLYK